MAKPTNVRGSATPASRDPLLNFKFLIKWDTKLVAGVSKIGALTRTTEVTDWREGGAPQVTRKLPGQTTYGDITLERGLIIDTAFEQWANKVWFYETSGTPIKPGEAGTQVSLKDFRKDITIEVCDQSGQVVKRYLAFNCWPSEYQGMPDLDASSNDVALETMTLVNEGWQRDDSLKAPELPGFTHPEEG
jgi:phage tail-like protein